MSKRAHTPGPWNYSLSNIAFTAGAITFGSDTTLIGEVYGKNGDTEYSPEEEMKANARLIAAAPALLEELILLLKYTNDVGDEFGTWPDQEQLNDCKHAIEKATT